MVGRQDKGRGGAAGREDGHPDGRESPRQGGETPVVTCVGRTQWLPASLSRKALGALEQECPGWAVGDS